MIRPSAKMNTESTAASRTVGHACAFIILDRGFRVCLCNKAAALLLGIERSEIVGAHASRFLSDLPSPKLLQNPEGVSIPVSSGTHSGRALTLLCERQTWDDAPALLVQLQPCDSAEQDWLRQDLNRFQALAAPKDEGICITDCEGRIVYVNAALEAQTGYTLPELEGKTPRLFRSGFHPPDFYARLWDTLKAGREFCAVFINRRKTGELYFEKKTIRPFMGSGLNPTHYVAIGRDVSDSLRALEKLEYLANHDSLTGLPNRSLFRDRLHREFIRAVRHGGGFAVCYLDVDQLKPVNDLHGHAAGDALLQLVAKVLGEHLRKEDTVARLGGDEFGLILKDVSSAQGVRKVLNGLISQLRQGNVRDAGSAPMSVSIGVSLYPRDGKDEMTLMSRADRAMYRAKASGGGSFRFYNRRLDAGSVPRARVFELEDDGPMDPAHTRLLVTECVNPDLLYYLNLIDPTL